MLMPDARDETLRFKVGTDEEESIRGVLLKVYSALRERGYDPVNQLVGYLLSGDPTYITSHQNARNVIRQVERDEVLEELVKSYLDRTE